MIGYGIGYTNTINVEQRLVYDANALSFITAAGLTDNTQKVAVNTLVTDLKLAGVWAKSVALYPYVGGSATAHKFNLKDPRDLDVAYRLSFVGGWTHSSNGALPNGTTGYANTFITPSTNLTTLSHLSFYSRTDNTDAEIMGVQTDNVSTSSQFYVEGNKTVDRYSALNSDANRITPSASTTNAFYNVNRTSSINLTAFKNGTKVGTNTNTSTLSRPNKTIFIGAFNYWSVGAIQTIYYGSKQCAGASVGEGLSDSEALALYNAFQTFNTTLGRNN